MLGGAGAGRLSVESEDRLGDPSDGALPTGSAPCANCGGGPVMRYCASCGQRAISDRDYTVGGFLHETVHEFTSVDGRLLATLWALLARPGLLAREYFAGRGTRYMKPLSLFVLLNLVFFLIQPHTGLLQYSLAGYIDYDGDVAARRQDAVNATRIDRAVRAEQARRARRLPAHVPATEPMPEFRIRFDTALQDQMKSMLIVSIPLFAIAMWVLSLGTERRFAEHLVFSVHVYAYFLFLAGIVVTPLFVLVFRLMRAFGASDATLNVLSSEGALIAFLFVAIGSYIYLGLRRMYFDARLAAAVRAVALFAVMQLLIIGYENVLFYATLASL